MKEPYPAPPPPEEALDPRRADPLAPAAERLNNALAGVEARLRELHTRLARADADARAAESTDADRSRLAAALDAARAREGELFEAAKEASEALEAAIDELRAALPADPGPGGAS